MSMSTSPVPLSKLHEVTLCLRVIASHARAVFSLEDILEEYGSLLELWYFREPLRETYEAYLTTSCLHGPRHTYIFLDLLASFPRAATTAWPEEREMIGQECVKMATSFLEKQTLVLQQSLQRTINYHLLLDSQFRDEIAAVLTNMKRKEFKPPKEFVPPPTPGAESNFQNKESLENVWKDLKIIMALTKSISEIPIIVVYDTQIAVTEVQQVTININC